jgi:hypothetical protein
LAYVGTTRVYMAAADDLADISSTTLQYSLESSDDVEFLQIDSASGWVTLAPNQGFLSATSKSNYTFTVKVTDGVNDAIAQTVSVDLANHYSVIGPRTSEQGAIVVTSSASDLGVLTLSFSVLPDLIDSFQAGIENLDLEIEYSPDDIQPVTGDDFSSAFTFFVTNIENPGSIVVSAFTLTPYAIDSSDPFLIWTLEPTTSEPTAIVVNGVILNVTDVAVTSVTIGLPVEITGTSDADSFLLEGGIVSVFGGEGADKYLVGTTYDGGVTILDFDASEDTIDVSLLLDACGYTQLTSVLPAAPVDGLAVKVLSPSLDLLTLAATNDESLDNCYGITADSEAGVLVGFYDADSRAEVVDIQLYRMDLGDQLVDLTSDNLEASLGAFIA